MPGDVTPEEKLLKLIKNNAQIQHTTEPVPADRVSAPPQAPHSPSNKAIPKNAWVKKLTTTSSVLSVVLISVLGYQLMIAEPVLPLPVRKSLTATPLELPRINLETKNPVDYYEKIYSKRNFFKDMGEPPPITNTTAKAQSLGDISKTLFLSGIISGDQPQAIVEDRSNGQIYYVNSGDFIGPIQVVDITDNHILIKYRDEEGQLTL